MSISVTVTAEMVAWASFCLRSYRIYKVFQYYKEALKIDNISGNRETVSLN
jgi:hypothetical protein